MKKVVLLFVFTYLFIFNTNAQNKINVSILIEKVDSSDIQFKQIIEEYVIEHLKKKSNIVVKDNKDLLLDTNLSNKAKEKGLNKIIFVSYFTNCRKTKMTTTSSGTSDSTVKFAFSCSLNFGLKIADCATDSISDQQEFFGDSSKPFYYSKGDGKESKIFAIKEALSKLAAGRFNDRKTIDDYFNLHFKD